MTMPNSDDSKVLSDLLDQLSTKLSTNIPTKTSNNLMFEIQKIQILLRAQEKQRRKENVPMIVGLIGLSVSMLINIINLDVKISNFSTSINSQIENVRNIINNSSTIDNSVTSGVGIDTDVRINTR